MTEMGAVQELTHAPNTLGISEELMATIVNCEGDFAKLKGPQRHEYYVAVCKSLGLNPLTKPFEWLMLNGKLRLYALRDCADQLRRVHGISIYISNRERMGEIYIVTARAKDRTGREDESTGAVSIGTLKGDALANALMKTETKAKRRVTLSIAGLGWLDETEVEAPKTASDGLRPFSANDDGDATNALGMHAYDRAIPVTEEVDHPTSDEITTLIDLATDVGIDRVVFGQDVRRLMHLGIETAITKKFLRETMTRPQYDACLAHYIDLLKQQVEQAVQAEADADVPLTYPPDDAESSETHESPLENTGIAVDSRSVIVEAASPTHEDSLATPVWAPSPEQETLRQEALGWGIPDDEIVSLLQRSTSIARARSALWKIRMTPVQEPALE